MFDIYARLCLVYFYVLSLMKNLFNKRQKVKTVNKKKKNRGTSSLYERGMLTSVVLVIVRVN